MERRTFLLSSTLAAIPSFGAESRLSFDCSDRPLAEGFAWAKRQALAFVFEGDPVGPWYEAALPGREAFCMRDVAHQSTGGHALGLDVHNRNMLHRFAENISESKDWCSYWEIDRYNRPAPVDYKNDAEFWYNLPANFDILDCCYRMYLWTGDLAYLNDRAFLNFYDRTVTDYVQRWDLDVDRVMRRKRFLNVRGSLDSGKKFQFFRGDPSYEEARDDFVLGIDLLATQYSAYLSYARLQDQRGNADAAQAFLRKAREVKALINKDWWDEKSQHFYAHLSKDYVLQGRAGSSLLYRDAADDGPKAKAALQTMLDAIKQRPSAGVEGQSHHAEILYRYGVPEVAYSQLVDLTREGRDRREYPEVSYSVIGAIVTGVMGVSVEPVPPSRAAEDGNFVDRSIKTRPAHSNFTSASLGHLAVRANEISVTHEGGRRTIFTNERGPSLLWQAEFVGSHENLSIDGRAVRATQESTFLSRKVSWVRSVVAPGTTVRVEIPA